MLMPPNGIGEGLAGRSNLCRPQSS